MSCFLASLLSTTLGILLFKATSARKFVNAFSMAVGTSVYALNKYGIESDHRVALSQRLSRTIVAKLAVLIVVLAIVVAGACVPFYWVQFDQFKLWELAVYGGFGVLVPCIVYFLCRRKPEPLEYPPSKQLFYYLTLGVPNVGKCLFALERMCFRRAGQVSQAIIVTGLARAGTTILLQYLNEHSRLRSLTYRQMPFLLSSRCWRRINRARSEKVERSHRDGIMVSLDSPEAFDEYYWRVILEDNFNNGNALAAHSVNESQILQYEKYVAGNVKLNDVVYLSKNNNFLLRAGSFLEQRQNYTVVVVYRAPIEHAVSLHRQHRIQSKIQEQNPFARDYMEMLGHHEFGHGRLDFVFGKREFAFEDKADLNYWLERWVDYYQNALSLQSDRLLFVGNDLIATKPSRVVNAILGRVGLTNENEHRARENGNSNPSDHTKWALSSANVDASSQTYAELKARAATSQEFKYRLGPIEPA